MSTPDPRAELRARAFRSLSYTNSRGERDAQEEGITVALALAGDEIERIQAERVRDLKEAAKELRARGRQRDEVGSDDGPECDGECESSDCHTVSAVATWHRAAAILERRIAALSGVQQSPGDPQ